MKLLLLWFITMSVPAMAAELKGTVFLKPEGTPIKDAIVYVVAGPPVPPEIVLNPEWQIKAGKLTPKIFVTTPGTPAVVANLDNTVYSMMIIFQENKTYNRLIKPGGKVEFQVTRPELFAPAMGDALSSLHGFVCVLERKIYAITEPDGSFTFKNLPPGDYQIRAAHWNKGRAEQAVNIKDKPVTLRFSLPGFVQK